MKYNIMRTLCMFDLPMDTKKEQRIYRQFRKYLQTEGFLMVQYSIYVRICPTREFVNRLIQRIKKKTPEDGNVRILTITEKQYEDMVLLVGSKSLREIAIGTERLVII